MEQSSSPVDLWLISLGSDDTVSIRDLSNTEDLMRCEQIVVPKRKRRFIFRRRALHYVLSRYLPRYNLEFEASGKPVVRCSHGQPRLNFSTSASRDVCAVCVCTHEVGIDVEASPPTLDLADIVTQFMPDSAARTKAACGSSAKDESLALRAHRQHLATMNWCRLEAYTKLHGHTLHHVLFEEHDRLPQTLSRDDHHIVVVANLDWVCVVAQRQPFRVARVHQIDFSRIACEQA